MSTQVYGGSVGSSDEYSRFLFTEADLLDSNRFSEWLTLLTSDIDYRVPLRLTRERGAGPEFSDRAFYLRENFGSLQTRARRLESEYAWAMNPPTRTRRLVTNIRMDELATGSNANEVAVRSNLAVYCYRGDTPVPVILTGERRDLLRRVGSEWKLARRLVLLDCTVLGLQALSTFL